MTELGAYAHAGDHAANVGDVTQVHALLHGQEQEVYSDAGYQGGKAPAQQQVLGHLARSDEARQAQSPAEFPLGQAVREDREGQGEHLLQGRHPFHVVKNLFGHRKARYRGLEKNTAQLFTLFGLANLVLARGQLLAPDARGAP